MAIEQCRARRMTAFSLSFGRTSPYARISACMVCGCTAVFCRSTWKRSMPRGEFVRVEQKTNERYLIVGLVTDVADHDDSGINVKSSTVLGGTARPG